MLAVSLLLYCNFHSGQGRFFDVLELFQAFVSGMGAAGLILCALNLQSFARLLEHSLPEYLGRISYSLYLTHSVVLFAMLDLLYGRLPFFLLTVVTFAVALALAHVFCLAIEEPANREGKRLASRALVRLAPLRSESTVRP